MQYEAAGASCLSVLTDERFFQGSLNHLKQIRTAVKLPLLRKDFVIDERQFLETVEWGADAILLIVAILTDAQLKHFHSLASDAGLAALVEVHDEAELGEAIEAGAPIIGVNNRDLKTFDVTLQTSLRLAKLIPDERLFVVESGIHSKKDIDLLLDAGADAFLIGEYFLTAPDPAAAIRGLL